MEKISKWTEKLQAEMCNKCGKYTENSEINDREYTVETWTCEGCGEEFCNECYDSNEIPREDHIDDYCNKCYEEEKNVKN